MQLQTSLDPAELDQLAVQWGVAPIRRHRLPVDDPFLTGDHQLLASRGRRAEICYVMHRSDPAAGVLLHIKTYYPDDAYRLPTGGIQVGETVTDTLAREIHEETGLIVGDGAGHVQVQRFLGVLVYDLVHHRLGTVKFATYHFLVRMPNQAELNPQDPDESIQGWQWRAAGDLYQVAETLDEVYLRSRTWADWGHFRALSHRFVGDMLCEA